MRIIEADYIVIGSGPGGATVARELAKAGKDVIILEKGKRHEITASRLKSYSMYDKFAVFSRSKEGVIIDRAVTVGGCSVVFSGNSFDPPPWLADVMGVDVTPEADEIKAEISIRPFTEDFMAPWSATRSLRESAARMDVNLIPQSKFIRQEMCRNVCDGCMTGCRNNAKWTAREWIDEAVGAGARLLVQADVRRVIIESGQARGVEARTPRGDVKVLGKKVIAAAGGIGSGIILQQSGLSGAGGNFYMDPMNVLWGMADKPITGTSEMTFSHACVDMADSKGFVLGNVSGKGAWVCQLMRPATGWKALGAYGKWDRMTGMFIKIADSAEGRVFPNGAMSKPSNDEDRKKAEEATELAKKIMIGAGVNPDSILVAENIGGHPGGTAAVGQITDSNLRVKGVDNLYVCDASVFPKSPGRPPTLMIMALAKKFSKTLLDE